jgi:hypothetical protein
MLAAPFAVVRRALKAVKYEATVPEILLADADPSLPFPPVFRHFCQIKKMRKRNNKNYGTFFRNPPITAQ